LLLVGIELSNSFDIKASRHYI